MTRTERLEQYIHDLFCAAPLNGWDDAQVASEILKIADDRVFLIGADIARRIGRSPNTIGSWRERRKHQFPEPVYQTGMGPLWDSEDIERWAADHPQLLGPEAAAPTCNCTPGTELHRPGSRECLLPA